MKLYFIFLSSDAVYHPFPCCSLSSPCLRASSFIIRAPLWEAIREKLTQLPASLSRLQPHQASPLPAVTRMAGHYDGSGLASCKIFIDAPLGPWELCTNTLTHSQIHLHADNSLTKTIKCCSWSQLLDLRANICFCRLLSTCNFMELSKSIDLLHNNVLRLITSQIDSFMFFLGFYRQRLTGINPLLTPSSEHHMGL